jgi:hypothetical protein
MRARNGSSGVADAHDEQTISSSTRRLAGWAVSASVLLVALIGLTACGSGGGDAGRTTTTANGRQAILIRTYVDTSSVEDPRYNSRVGVADGTVLGGSSLGGAPFCRGGTTHSRHGNDAIGLVDRTFRCADGTVRIGFTPGVPQGRTQAGPWKVLAGSGAYRRLRGSGQMKMVYDSATSQRGHETFTGHVLR